MLIIESLLKEPCFSALRTKKQLGYIVFSVFRNKRRVFGHFIIVQSHVAAPAVLADHISEFLSEMRPIVAELSDESFATHRDSVYTTITKRDISLEEEFGRYAVEMIGLHYQFDKRERLGEALQRCSKAQIQATFERVFFTECKRLDIEYVRANLMEEQTKLMESKDMRRFKSVGVFKRGLPIYPGQLDSHS
jgi:secreted Zn-dependent insulinase-like peptidase